MGQIGRRVQIHFGDNRIRIAWTASPPLEILSRGQNFPERNRAQKAGNQYRSERAFAGIPDFRQYSSDREIQCLPQGRIRVQKARIIPNRVEILIIRNTIVAMIISRP